MSTLWDKGNQLDKFISQFTVGNDPVLDTALIYYDCLGSIAHAHMLHIIGILSYDEMIALKDVLSEIIDQAEKGSFIIQLEDEDVHTAVENYLIVCIGDIGKKIHTARSRNDQVALDLRLYMKDQLLSIANQLLILCSSVQTQAERYAYVPMAGRTHFQKAMPSSIGLWLGAFLESMLDNCMMLKHTFTFIDQCPLGSAAGFGVSLSIDRQLVSDLLGFQRVQENVLYVANSRGKFESVFLELLVSIMIDLSKLATDLIIFSSPEFAYLTLPETLCTGSSMMPQKKNPDALELIRGKASAMIGYLMQVLGIIHGLPSGYNRDFQETKNPLMQGCLTTHGALTIMDMVANNMIINSQQCFNSCTPEIFATDQANHYVQEGIPFRDAYKRSWQNLDQLSDYDPVANIISKKHLGAPGNLGFERRMQTIHDYREWVEEKREMIKRTYSKLRD